jgi:hydroxymethylbilane synthase
MGPAAAVTSAAATPVVVATSAAAVTSAVVAVAVTSAAVAATSAAAAVVISAAAVAAISAAAVISVERTALVAKSQVNGGAYPRRSSLTAVIKAAVHRVMVWPLRIGTRGSPLALWQANYVADRLTRLLAPRSVEVIHLQTEGDRDQSASLAHIGGRGVFTKEIERAVLDGRVDVAVHSLKDLPTQPVEGLMLAAVPERGPTGDAFVSHSVTRFDDLPQRARVATGSLRRRAQLLNRRPDLELADIRGNVGSRLQKLRDGGFDAIILAQAGLERLGLTSAATEILDPDWMLPGVGQGALGLQCRTDDQLTCELLVRLDDPRTRQAVEAERSLLLHLGGGCQVPLGALARANGPTLTLRAAVLAVDGSRRITGEEIGIARDAAAIGERLAGRLRDQGAGKLIRGD